MIREESPQTTLRAQKTAAEILLETSKNAFSQNHTKKRKMTAHKERKQKRITFKEDAGSEMKTK